MFDLSTPYDYYLIFFDSTSLNSFEYARNLYISKLKTKNIKINDTLSSVIFVSTMIEADYPSERKVFSFVVVMI